MASKCAQQSVLRNRHTTSANDEAF